MTSMDHLSKVTVQTVGTWGGQANEKRRPVDAPQLSVSDGDGTWEVAGDDVLPEAFSDDDDDVLCRHRT